MKQKTFIVTLVIIATTLIVGSAIYFYGVSKTKTTNHGEINTPSKKIVETGQTLEKAQKNVVNMAGQDGEMVNLNSSDSIQQEFPTISNICCVPVPEDKFKENLTKTFRDFGDISVKDSIIPGLKEVTVKRSGEIFYSNCDGTVAIIGAMLGENGKNYTKESMETASKAVYEDMLKTIDFTTALKFGEGKNIVLEFTDPDCPFCRQAEPSLSEEQIDATRYVFLTALHSLHPTAAKKIEHIFCSENPNAEYMKIMNNEEPSELLSCDKGKKIVQQLDKIGEDFQITGTPTFIVNGIKYIGADPDMYKIINRK